MSERYTAVAMVLHWLIAIGILALIGVGLAMTHLTLAPMLQFQLYQLHKSIGITVLLGVLLRILWRVFHPPPALPDMPRLEKAAAEGAHTLLYVLMIVLPPVGRWSRFRPSTCRPCSTASCPGRICRCCRSSRTRRRSRRW